MVSQITVDKIVQKIFPKEYKPIWSKNIVSISCVSSNKIRNIRQSYYPNHEEPKEFLKALVLNLGDIYDEESEMYDHRYIIYVSEDVGDDEELSFILLNQLGYIDLYLEFPNRKKVDESLYADFFALQVLDKIFGQKKARELASKYGSIEGE